MFKRFFSCLVILMCAASVPAQGDTASRAGRRVMTGKWVSVASKLKDPFFSTPEARRIGDNVLLYQHNTGGWPKNVNMQMPLDSAARAAVEKAKDDAWDSTIDNRATSTEIVYLSRLYNATKEEKYRDGALRGMDYLFRAQYGNGGWPQFWPRDKGYYTHITYNDDAMVHVLRIMRDVCGGAEPFGFMPDSVREKARKALDRGVECIVRTQVVQDGRPAVWCAQYDEHTLAPAPARAYELVSLSGSESCEIVLFLMSLPEPSPEVAACVENAVAWFRRSVITGLRRETFVTSDGKRDYRMVPCAGSGRCQPLWARFYTIDSNRPFFCDRDGVKRYDLSEIGYERRNGYSWYTTGGADVLAEYERWKRK